MNLQHQIQVVNETQLEHTKTETEANIRERHKQASNIMRESVENIMKNCEDDGSFDEAQDEIDRLFAELEGN